MMTTQHDLSTKKKKNERHWTDEFSRMGRTRIELKQIACQKNNGQHVEASFQEEVKGIENIGVMCHELKN
jgi:hypothetical protein